jgi:aspartate-semialdehyde dehydrogenase
MKIAIVGATGLVGSVIIRVLEEARYLPLNQIQDFIPVASHASQGKLLEFCGRHYQVTGMEEAIHQNPDIAIFSAGAATSLEWAPIFAKAGIVVIDNSSAWRMEPQIPLVVPEINAATITDQTTIIANPNCSTIQLVMAMAPLHRKYGLRRLVVSTYQSVTGTGVKGVRQLENERAGNDGEKIYPHRIDLNLIPQGGDFNGEGYTAEETKLLNETRKILDAPEIMVTSTVVRVPVYGGHSMSVNAEFSDGFDLDEVKSILHNTPGIIVQDDPANAVYPMPIYAQGKDEVFVGRIRRDNTIANGLNLWIVADNLRKGAATNAVQIAAVVYNLKRKNTA